MSLPTEPQPGADATTTRTTGRAAGTWQTLPGGLVAGTVATASAATFATLLFSGVLTPQRGPALGWAVLASLVHLLVVARLCSVPGTLATAQSLSVAVLAAALDTAVRAVDTPAALVGTALATLLAGTALTGGVLLLLGRVQAGRLVRFLPYPVLIGVVASSGWLLAVGAVRLLDAPASPIETAAAGPDATIITLAAAAWAVLTLLAHRRWPHPLTALLMLAGATVLCHAVAAAWGWSAADMQRAGWLLAVPPDTPWTMLVQPLVTGKIDWQALSAAAPMLAAVPAVTTIALLMNAAALETAAGQPLDLDRELRAAGAANLVAAPLGGLPGYHQLGLSAMNLRHGLRHRRLALWAALPGLAVLAIGPSTLTWLPLPTMGALLLFLALQIVHDALAGSWGRLSGLERAIVALVVGTTALVGFLAGLTVGLVAAVLLFAVHCAQIDPVRHAVSGADLASRVARGHAVDEQVRRIGASVLVLQLQGFLFFGIADRLQQRVRLRLSAPCMPPLRYLVLDCRQVLGSDSSAIHGFWLLAQTLVPEGVVLVVAHAAPRMRDQLAAAGLRPGPRCHQVDDLDRALEWCEDALLAHEARPAATPAPSPPNPQSLEAVSLSRLLLRLPRIELAAGQRFITQGSTDRDLFILASGSVSTVRHQGDGSSVRLQTVRGSIVVLGEIGFFTGRARTADVVAETDSVVLHLGRSELERLEAEEPALALALYRHIGLEMARRVEHLVGVVSALEG